MTEYPPGAAAPALTTPAGSATGLQSPSAVTLDAAGHLYVANQAANTITVYAAGGGGDAAPIATIQGPDTQISGSATGLNSPHGLTQDAAGDLLVTNQYGHTVTIYAPGTTGNAFPQATLGGSSTLLSYPSGIDLDSAGRAYVANQYDNDIHVYAPGAPGDTAPIATLGGGATGIAGPGALAVTPRWRSSPRTCERRGWGATTVSTCWPERGARPTAGRS